MYKYDHFINYYLIPAQPTGLQGKWRMISLDDFRRGYIF